MIIEWQKHHFPSFNILKTNIFWKVLVTTKVLFKTSCRAHPWGWIPSCDRVEDGQIHLEKYECLFPKRWQWDVYRKVSRENIQQLSAEHVHQFSAEFVRQLIQYITCILIYGPLRKPSSSSFRSFRQRFFLPFGQIRGTLQISKNLKISNKYFIFAI